MKKAVKKAGSTIATATGIGTGMLVSNGVTSTVPFDNKNAARALVLAAGLAGAIFINGKTRLAKFGKDASIGMVAQQGKALLTDAVKDHLPKGDGVVNEFINASFEVPNITTGPTTKSMNSPFMRLGTPDVYRSQLGNPYMNGQELNESMFQTV